MGIKLSKQELENLSPEELGSLLVHLGERFDRFKPFVVAEDINGQVLAKLSDSELSQICLECGMTVTQRLVVTKKVGFLLESVEITSRSISFDYQLMTEVELSLAVCTFGLSPNSNCRTDVRLS